MMKILEQLKALVELAENSWTDEEFCFYKSQLEKYVEEQFLFAHK